MCVCECVFPHTKARSLIFNAAETTTSTQSEAGEACFPAQTSLPWQQETKLGATVWNGSKPGSRHTRTLKNQITYRGFFQLRNKAFPAVELGRIVHVVPFMC